MIHRASLIVIILVCAVIVPVTAGLHQAAPRIKTPPNIVLIAIDTLRRDHLGCYGYKRPVSPNIDKLAAEGVLFERSYSPASWTLPSFTSMFTGLLPATHGIGWGGSRRLSAAIPTLAEHLKKKGYYCTAVVSNPCAAGKYGLAKGFDVYDDYSIHLGAELGMFAVDYGQDLGAVNNVVTGESVTQQAILQLSQAKKTGKPFFLFALYFDPHDSYIPPVPYDRKFDPEYKGKIDGKNIPSLRNRPPSARDIQNLIARYDGEIQYTDMQVGKLVRHIDKTFSPRNTIIILVSDHGEAFGEHGMLLHGNSAYKEEVCIPMIWRWRGVLPKGHRVKNPVLNMDIAKTLSELLRLDRFTLLQGQSLWAGLMNKGKLNNRAILSQKACGGNTSGLHLALTQAQHRLHIHFKKHPTDKDAKWTLFNIEKDPWEKTDVLKHNTPLAKKMFSILKKKWEESLEIRAYYLTKGKNGKLKLSPEERRRLESMGYLNKAGN